MNPVGFMVWRIGRDADILSQIRWVRRQGFDAVSFHASVDPAGNRAGIDPERASRTDIGALRKTLAGFRMVEIHADFRYLDISRPLPDRETADFPLRPTLSLAAAIGADVLTVHIVSNVTSPEPSPRDECRLLREWITFLDAVRPERLRIGFETTDPEFLDVLRHAGNQGIGITLDIGHFFLGNRAVLAGFGGDLARLVAEYLPAVVHFHLHDVRGNIDHLPPGRGEVDFARFFAAVRSRRYAGAFCWELNPDRATPTEIAEAAAFTRSHLRSAGPTPGVAGL